jgi:hypothetical protein
VMMNKLLWGLQKHGIYVCVYIYNIHISSIPYQVRFARRWHEKELSSQKKLSLSIYVYLYLYTFYMHIYIYNTFTAQKKHKLRSEPGNVIGLDRPFGCRFQILQLYNCFMVSLKGNKSTAPNQEHRWLVGVVEPIKKIGDKTVASDFRRF